MPRAISLRTSFATLSAADIGPTLAFLGVLLFDVSGIAYGMARMADLVDERDHVPGALFAFLAAALGTVVGAALGSTPVIIHVESAAGIKEGARTGLASLVAALLFLASLFLAPLFTAVPEYATAPVLMLIGCMMMSEAANVDWRDMRSAVPAFLTAVMMPFTYDVANGLAFGICASVLLFFTTGGFVRCGQASPPPAPSPHTQRLPRPTRRPGATGTCPPASSASASWTCTRTGTARRGNSCTLPCPHRAPTPPSSAMQVRRAPLSQRRLLLQPPLPMTLTPASPRGAWRSGEHERQRSPGPHAEPPLLDGRRCGHACA